MCWDPKVCHNIGKRVTELDSGDFQMMVSAHGTSRAGSYVEYTQAYLHHRFKNKTCLTQCICFSRPISTNFLDLTLNLHKAA